LGAGGDALTAGKVGEEPFHLRSLERPSGIQWSAAM
jgi:hypothetical protein